MRSALLALALASAVPAAATSHHDWIDRTEAPVRVTGVEVGFHPLAAPAGETAGLAAPLAAAIRTSLAEWGQGSGTPVTARVTV